MKNIPDDMLILILKYLENWDSLSFFGVNKQLFDVYKSGKANEIIKSAYIDIFEETYTLSGNICDDLFYDNNHLRNARFSQDIISKYENGKYQTVIGFLKKYPEIESKLNTNDYYPQYTIYDYSGILNYLALHRNNIIHVIVSIGYIEDLSYILKYKLFL